MHQSSSEAPAQGSRPGAVLPPKDGEHPSAQWPWDVPMPGTPETWRADARPSASRAPPASFQLVPNILQGGVSTAGDGVHTPARKNAVASEDAVAPYDACEHHSMATPQEQVVAACGWRERHVTLCQTMPPSLWPFQRPRLRAGRTWPTYPRHRIHSPLPRGLWNYGVLCRSVPWIPGGLPPPGTIGSPSAYPVQDAYTAVKHVYG